MFKSDVLQTALGMVMGMNATAHMFQAFSVPGAEQIK